MWVLDGKAGQVLPANDMDGLYNSAISYFVASTILAKEKKLLEITSPLGVYPLYNNINHTIELILKAYLSFDGLDINAIRKKYGHNLKAMIEECDKRKLPLESNFKVLASKEHWMHKDHKMRYFDSGWTFFSNIENIMPCLESQIKQMRLIYEEKKGWRKDATN